MIEFRTALQELIAKTQAMPRFKGQTQAIKALRRINQLAAFNDPRSAYERNRA